MEKIGKKEKVMEKEKEIGRVTHYFDKVGVAVIELKAKLNVGNDIHIKGATTDFVQEVDSMQVEHKKIAEAKKGEAIGLKTLEKVRPNDTVYLVS
ncbi:translation elongation factor-like protein [Candidatus Pacearchaeota archaeon]|nr:translation elongation factor-like protein [Candidatus Pacearchaeota archaeon]